MRRNLNAAMHLDHLNLRVSPTARHSIIGCFYIDMEVTAKGILNQRVIICRPSVVTFARARAV